MKAGTITLRELTERYKAAMAAAAVPARPAPAIALAPPPGLAEIAEALARTARQMEAERRAAAEGGAR